MKARALGVSFAVLAALAVVTAPGQVVRAGPTEDVRTFEVTVRGDDGVPEVGKATATFLEANADHRFYQLRRVVGGPSADYSTGTAMVDGKGRITVAFVRQHDATGGDATAPPSAPTPGFVAALATADGGSPDPGTAPVDTARLEGASDASAPLAGEDVTVVTLHPEQATTYVFSGEWTTHGHHFAETWRELTHLTAGIRIVAPEEGASVALGSPVDFEASVHDARRVEFLVDDVPIASFAGAGDHHASRALTKAGFRHFVVNAYGPPTLAHPRGVLVGSADSMFEVVAPEPDALPPPSTPAAASRPTADPTIGQAPASPRNYDGVSTRKTAIVIHKAEGSLDATVSWFRNPRSKVSAHYCVDDDRIVQSVPDAAVCWHTGNHDYNQFTIGIENSGYTDADDMTEAHYRRLASLVAHLCAKHSIPIDRQHVIGHDEVPDPFHPGEFGGANHHRDPGPHWEWEKLMSYVHEAAGR